MAEHLSVFRRIYAPIDVIKTTIVMTTLVLALSTSVLAADLLSVTSPTVTGDEDTAIPLGLNVNTQGGAQLNILSTATGFKDASTGSTPTLFTIPPTTTHIKLTALGGSDNSAFSEDDEDFQLVSLTVDLASQTYSGHVGYSVDLSTDNGNYTFMDVPLGSSSVRGSVTGYVGRGSLLLPSVEDDQFSLISSTNLADQAYIVEFLSNETTSAHFIGGVSALMEPGVTADTISLENASELADFVRVSLSTAPRGDNAADEKKGMATLIIDMNTLTASGVIFNHTGAGANQVASYAFSNYDLTSGNRILQSSASIVGDDSASVIVNPILSLSGTNLTISRSTAIAAEYTGLLSAELYTRESSGSAATLLGASSAYEKYAPTATPTVWNLDIPIGAEFGTATLVMTSDVTATSTSGENLGVARFAIDLINQTTNGSYLTMRSTVPDAISWHGLPFGTRIFDGDSTVSNRAGVTNFLDEISAVMTFDVDDDVIGRDTDRDDIPDSIDSDADGDGIPDIVEGSGDADGDGVANNLDTDSDNDGIPDMLDGAVDDDGDGIANYLDLDSDNDGIADLIEAGGSDINRDGRVDNFFDIDGDGLDDSVQALPLQLPDTDADGIRDYLDLDADNDGVSDTLETPNTELDANGDGLIDNTVDTNGDGWSDSAAGKGVLDTDEDGVPNYQDLDSDGDGFSDLLESGGVDTNADGVIDGWADVDGDGISDNVDADQLSATDVDGDGIADFADADFLTEDDSDGDGIVDRFDTDPFADGFARASNGEPLLGAVLPDTDGDGTPDMLQATAVTGRPDGFFRTGVSGGSMGPWGLMLLSVFGLLLVFRRWQALQP